MVASDGDPGQQRPVAVVVADVLAASWHVDSFALHPVQSGPPACWWQSTKQMGEESKKKISAPYIYSNICWIAGISTSTRPLSNSRPCCMVNFDLDFSKSTDWLLICGCLRPSSLLRKQNSSSATNSDTNNPPMSMKNMPATLLSDSSLRDASCLSADWHSVRSNHHLLKSFVNSPLSISDSTAKLMGTLRMIRTEIKNEYK